MTFAEWKKAPKTLKEIEAAGTVIARDNEGRSRGLEDLMVDGPYLDNIELGLTSKEEETEEFDKRFDWIYKQVLKKAKEKARENR